jgi:hypothetical protein
MAAVVWRWLVMLEEERIDRREMYQVRPATGAAIDTGD